MKRAKIGYLQIEIIEDVLIDAEKDTWGPGVTLSLDQEVTLPREQCAQLAQLLNYYAEHGTLPQNPTQKENQ